MKLLITGGAGFIGSAVIRHIIHNTDHIVINVDKLTYAGNLEPFGRGFAWLDTGTHESLIEASQFIHTIEKRQGFKVACLEEVAYRNGWITKESLTKLGEALSKTEYGKYLVNIAKGSQ